MPFIGVIAKENDNNFIKNEIKKNAQFYKYEIVRINKKSLENIKNIKFDILIVNENMEELVMNSKYLEDIIANLNYAIVNSDIKNNLTFFQNTKTNIITYGFNNKATITISSVRDENTMLCIQRNIKGLNGKTIEEHEVGIKIEKNNINKLYNVLAIFAVLNIYGEKLKKI